MRVNLRPQILIYLRPTVSPRIQKILRICVRKRTGPQSAHLWFLMMMIITIHNI